jgi:hypothetical protein
MESVKFCKLLLQQFNYNKKAYNKFGTKPKLGRRRRRRRRNFSSKLQDTAWKKKKKLELWTCCYCTLAKCKPQARISVFVFLWYLPPSLTPFLSSFLPSCVLLGPGYYYFAT